ncbi:hypothetical protein [Silvanigrella aquatica]|uniref:Uncharacterized protein n=1 Tax=Silvanigrella aquatica TaxID=1915309 RepID=A0A1L4D1M3_9BACT|nr:hypothetical protein [Silvanigrella aquatica]APJ04091.1 hypothetical protein AXG55_09295 [Silvanigrella aquatica]
MTEEEATYLLNNGTRDVINLKKSKLLDVKFGEKRYMICSKKITDFELNKINKAILKINNFKIRE